MNNSQVAHIWAQQTKPSGKGSSFYFEGPEIYSYGPHFPIARFVFNKQGARCVLFTTRTYSNSTAKHLNYTRRALHGLSIPVFNVPSGNAIPNHDDNHASYVARLTKALKDAAGSRKYADIYLQTAERLVQEANLYAEFFELVWRLSMDTVTPEHLAELRKQAKVAAAAKARQTREREDARRIIEAGERDEWRRGGITKYFSNPVMLRLSADGETVQTSRGAEVPADHAKRVFKLVKKARDTSTPWQRNGHAIHIGEFQLDNIDAQGNIKAGCHVISWSEIEHCAIALGVQS